MWADICKRWLALCCWWLPTTKGEQENSVAVNPSRTVADDVSSDVTTTGSEVAGGPEEAVVDDLTVIKGIGPAIQTKLRSFGITSLAALAASDPEALTAKLSASQPISSTRVKGWIEAAQDRAAART